LGLAQIYPIWDEDTDEERIAVSASFADPYLAILRDDSSLLLLQTDASGDLEEVSLSDEMSTLKWRSGCLYHDKHRSFGALHTKSSAAEPNILLFLLNAENKLSVGDFNTE
jgi:cleavage and polyadenylation specificity factor subunit 1